MLINTFEQIKPFFFLMDLEPFFLFFYNKNGDMTFDSILFNGLTTIYLYNF